MTARFEAWLNRFFGDDKRRRFGSGWLSGVTSVTLGVLAICTVLAMHFPRWLTLPELRDRYPLELVRLAVDGGILAGLSLAAISMVLRQKKTLGMTGLILSGIALLLGAGGTEIGRADGTVIYIGLDWFVLGVLTTATIFIPLEKAFPQRPSQRTFRKAWLTDTQYFFVSHAGVQLVSVLVLLPVVNLGEVLSVSALRSFVQDWPAPLQFLACLAVADLAQYWVHRCFHAVPILWRFHSVHHSIETMDWIAGSRLHLVDVVVTRGLVLLPLIILGFSETALYAYLGFVSVHAVFIHANFRPRASWLEALIAMPRFHHWHHAKDPAAVDKNFAVHLPVLDRIFGTFHMPGDAWPTQYGIEGANPPQGYINQLFWPFRNQR